MGTKILIAGFVCAGVVLIALVVAFLIIFVYHRRKNRPEKAIMKEPEQQSIAKDNFTEYVKNLSANSGMGFMDQFMELRRVGSGSLQTQSQKSWNQHKNRFLDILPYDDTRVELLEYAELNGCDYINANYVPGFNSEREYIATQGPLEHTVDDFWNMIWLYDVTIIVMVTQCVERLIQKCHRYWPPDATACYYGDVKVQMIAQDCQQDWTVSTMHISMGYKRRTIQHFHYTTWPDRGVPSCLPLIDFVRLVRSTASDKTGPIVVHCSAGVGRSGTFMALDNLLQHIEYYDGLDIYGIVHKMRECRPCMVQTEPQYEFIHLAMQMILGDPVPATPAPAIESSEEECSDQDSDDAQPREQHGIRISQTSQNSQFEHLRRHRSDTPSHMSSSSRGINTLDSTDGSNGSALTNSTIDTKGKTASIESWKMKRHENVLSMDPGANQNARRQARSDVRLSKARMSNIEKIDENSLLTINIDSGSKVDSNMNLTTPDHMQNGSRTSVSDLQMKNGGQHVGRNTMNRASSYVENPPRHDSQVTLQFENESRPNSRANHESRTVSRADHESRPSSRANYESRPVSRTDHEARPESRPSSRTDHESRPSSRADPESRSASRADHNSMRSSYRNDPHQHNSADQRSSNSTNKRSHYSSVNEAYLSDT